jgi:sec-independent protein translocase protein TatB
MFDVGFQELVMIALVALLVVGPERLPKLVRTAGYWLGRGRRILGSVKAEIDREIKADELKDILRKQAASNPLTSILEDTASLASRSLSGTGLGTGIGGGSPGAHIKTAQADATAVSASAPVESAAAPPAAPADVTPGPNPRA